MIYLFFFESGHDLWLLNRGTGKIKFHELRKTNQS